MPKCQQHTDLKERVDKIDAKMDIIETEVTVMKTRFEDVGGGIKLSVTILGIIQVVTAAAIFLFKH
jgi:hypothetical protein